MINRMLIFAVCLLSFVSARCAGTDTLSYIGEKIKNGDTLQSVNVFYKFHWAVTAISKNGQVRKSVTARPDSLFKSNDLDSVFLSASVAVEPQLIDQIFAWHYYVDGSLAVLLNGRQILATGRFQQDRSSPLAFQSQDDFKDFLFKDTLEQISIIYLPHPQTGVFSLSLSIDQVAHADETQTHLRRGVHKSIGLGFYYLAFGIVFLILYIFFREKVENLYFALFCLFASLSFLWDHLHTDLLYNLDSFLGIISFEFLSIFLYKILRNKEKSKVSLLVIVLIMLVCFLPFIRYNYLFAFGAPIPWVVGGITVALYLYTVSSSFYFLVSGIGQKQWEARTILTICLVPVLGLIVAFILFIVYTVFTNAKQTAADHFTVFLYYLVMLIVYIYPLAAVIILGKRNGLNQKQLQAQLASIQQLSETNLAKEQEKQQILQNQKTLLEQEVAVRTTEVVNQKEKIEKQHEELKIEKRKSDELLLNILPEEVAEELKLNGTTTAKHYDNVTVLFTDFVNFTNAGERMSAQELINELHTCFKAFDEIASNYSIEKIKTIGDAYLAVAGLPAADGDHAAHIVRAAKDIIAFMQQRQEQMGDGTFKIRIGIHSGSVVAGIVGVKKFAYDIWGDTVNTAARMEQNSEAGKINISQSTYELVKERIPCAYRGEIDAKGKGMLKMYYVLP